MHCAPHTNRRLYSPNVRVAKKRNMLQSTSTIIFSTGPRNPNVQRKVANALHDPSYKPLRASSFNILMAASSIFSPSADRGMGFLTSTASDAFKQPGGAWHTAQAGTFSNSSHVGVEP